MNNEPFALLMNDLHVDKDNILEFEENWFEAVQVCKDNNISKILIGGDIFTTRNSQTLVPMLAVQKCLRMTGAEKIEVHIALGNHDLVNLDSDKGWCNIYEDMHNVFVYREHFVCVLPNVIFTMFSYWQEDTLLREKLDAYKAELDAHGIQPKDVILYLHAGIKGVLGSMDIPNELPKELVSEYRSVLCGHYHNRVAVKGTNIEYIGSSRAHNFGEDEEKGYTILFRDGTTRFVKNEVNIRYATEDLALKDVEGWESKYDERYKVRLRIHCTAAEADTVDRQTLLQAGASKIDFITEKIQAIEVESSDMEEKFDSGNLQIEYQSFCNEKDIDSSLGIDYLNKIS